MKKSSPVLARPAQVKPDRQNQDEVESDDHHIHRRTNAQAASPQTSPKLASFLFLCLPVICAGSVLSQVMLVVQPACRPVRASGLMVVVKICHPRHRFQNHRVMRSRCRDPDPRRKDHGWPPEPPAPRHSPAFSKARTIAWPVFFSYSEAISLSFMTAGHRDRAVEVVGMGGAETRNRPAGLGPGGSIFGMSVSDPSNSGKGPIEHKMSGQVGGGPSTCLPRSCRRDR